MTNVISTVFFTFLIIGICLSMYGGVSLADGIVNDTSINGLDVLMVTVGVFFVTVSANTLKK